MKKDNLLLAAAHSIFAVFVFLWLIIAFRGMQGESSAANIYSAFYGVMALFGGILGLRISKRWGGHKSLIGRSILFMSFGLLAQEAGQLAYSAYAYAFHVEIPYPSFGDIGYFGSVILYCLASYTLIKAVSTKQTLRSVSNRVVRVFVPVAVIAVAYVVFLSNYQSQSGQIVATVLDYGYPLGQALYVSFALLALLFAHRYMGGLIRPVIITVLGALCVQFAADFIFLYQTRHDTWKVAGYNELQYLFAYYCMTLGLIRFNSVFNHLHKKTGE